MNDFSILPTYDLIFAEPWCAEDRARKESTQYNSHGGHLVGSASRSNNLMTLLTKILFTKAILVISSYNLGNSFIICYTLCLSRKMEHILSLFEAKSPKLQTGHLLVMWQYCLQSNSRLVPSRQRRDMLILIFLKLLSTSLIARSCILRIPLF